MKKLLIALFSVLLLLCMSLTCFGEEVYEGDTVTERSYTVEAEDVDTEDTEFTIKKYLTERIAPIIAGVATSLVALFGGFSKLKSAVSGLDKTGKELKDIRDGISSTLSGIEGELKKGISQIEEKISSVPEIKEGYDEIRESCLRLKEQNERLLEALKLGFESIPEAVKCGNARKIAILSEAESSKETVE